MTLTMGGVPTRPRITWDQIVPGLEQIPTNLVPDADASYDLGAADAEWSALYLATLYLGAADGITASTSQSQGQQPLTASVNLVATVANASDTVTLPAAAAGRVCMIRNEGANTLQIFPASGDAIDGGAADAAITLAADAALILVAIDATDWYTFGGA